MIDDCDLFVLYKQFPSGGTIWRMLRFDETGTDYDDILAVADCLAESARTCLLTGNLLNMNHIRPINLRMHGSPGFFRGK